MTIHCVIVMRRRPVRGGVGGVAVEETSAVIGLPVRGEPGRLSAEGRVAVAVREVERETDREPDAEPLPRLSWQSLHHEEAGSGAAEADGPDEGHTKGPRAVRLRVPQNQDTDADEREGGCWGAMRRKGLSRLQARVSNTNDLPSQL